MRAHGIKLRLHVVPAATASAAIVQEAAELRMDALCLPLRRPSARSAGQAFLGLMSGEALVGCGCPILPVPPQSE